MPLAIAPTNLRAYPEIYTVEHTISFENSITSGENNLNKSIIQNSKFKTKTP
jgi:hypothetical protein